MNNLENVTSLLDSYCSDKITQANAIDPRYGTLWQEIYAYLMGGGKRMRPRLVFLAYDAYRASSSERDITSIASAWELLHACLLVHDDIIDRDIMRHGTQNLTGRYQSRYNALSSSDVSHYASSTALLGGDLLLMGAYELIVAAPIENETKLLALSYINKALFTVAGGELIDTDAILYPVEQSNPYAVAVHKTASYSLQLPLQCGSALAGAPSEELKKLSELGLHLGIAYQLQDDLLGIFGDTATTGKSNRSDIIEKKRTLLVQATLARLEEPRATRFRDLFAPDHIVSESEAEELFVLIDTSGAKKSVEQEIEKNTSQARTVLATLQISDLHKQHFSALIEKLTARNH